MTQIDELNLDKKLRTLFYYDPDELGEDAFKPLGDDEVEEITKLIATQINQARIEAQKEILAFATRVQANGQYIPIEVGLIPWLEAQLSNTHKEQL